MPGPVIDMYSITGRYRRSISSSRNTSISQPLGSLYFFRSRTTTSCMNPSLNNGRHSNDSRVDPAPLRSHRQITQNPLSIPRGVPPPFRAQHDRDMYTVPLLFCHNKGGKARGGFLFDPVDSSVASRERGIPLEINENYKNRPGKSMNPNVQRTSRVGGPISQTTEGRKTV